MTAPQPLKPSELRKICDPAIFECANTAELEPLDEVIGQERAVRAINLGLQMKRPGYNIFVTGPEGAGKRTIVKDIVSRYAHQQASPDDWCMVNNFDDPFRPKAIRVPTGKAATFAKSMDRLIRWLQIKLAKEFTDDAFKERMAQRNEAYRTREQEIMLGLEQLAGENNIQLARSTEGLRPVPLLDGQPMSHEQFEQLPEAQRQAISTALSEVGEAMEKGFAEIVKIRQAHQKAMDQFMQEAALSIVKERIDLLRSEYTACSQILSYLDAVQQDIVDQVETFVTPEDGNREQPEAPFPIKVSPFDRYKVNVLVDRKGDDGAPVVFEPNPSFQNLFGYIDKKTFMGAATTDFTMVQAGSMLQANGGYLIIEVESLLMDVHVWETLKRSLQNRQLYIQDLPHGPPTMSGSLRPAPIALDMKVILVGNVQTFELLQNHDSKFNKIFKVRADFDYEAALDDASARLYARFIARVCGENGLMPFSAEAIAAVVEQGTRTVANQNKLSLRFGPIVGLIQEADFWAKEDDAQQVGPDHVEKALTEHRFRYNLYEEKIHASYVDDTIFIDVDGAVVGQVNALAVYQVGEISFGRPSRITAETFMGKPGIVNIEREARMSGSTHDKGVMILSGCLGRLFAQQYPLSLSISITFEQSYSGVDGDSASSTELYAILSSLSGIPIRQGIAVTGSVNQKGQVQAIGGVNQKIEGFFEVCKTKGLTGQQGVMIPKTNVNNLMLSREVLDAVEQNQFNIYPVETIEEGIEVLTGTVAGQADANHRYPIETIYGKAQEKLAYFARQAMKFKNGAASVPEE